VPDVLTRSLADIDSFDPRPPMTSSGLRIGTPALATRGFEDEDFREVADIIATALKPDFDDDVAAGLRKRVSILAAKHPLYPEPGDSNGAQ
jgi:glycine hydroxymethyltransferase